MNNTLYCSASELCIYPLFRQKWVESKHALGENSLAKLTHALLLTVATTNIKNAAHILFFTVNIIHHNSGNMLKKKSKVFYSSQ